MPDDITLILQQIEGGDPQAQDRLLELVYAELRKLASRGGALERQLRKLRGDFLVSLCQIPLQLRRQRFQLQHVLAGLLQLLAQHPVVLHGGTIELCELPRS